ncbi:hypothetical protein [Novosphingobium fuchskuhlense]|uniref:hypothetical protein n=1 Tax=Novosphingobium fuchskuhlense TaxID=1117702 RepID=UPI0012E3B473|nr:hypothetical protein [Novosphingobium fuchskuhlense]
MARMAAATGDCGRVAAAYAPLFAPLTGPFRLAGPDRTAIPIHGHRTRMLRVTLLLAP